MELFPSLLRTSKGPILGTATAFFVFPGFRSHGLADGAPAGVPAGRGGHGGGGFVGGGGVGLVVGKVSGFAGRGVGGIGGGGVGG